MAGGQTINIFYDGECPFCSRYVRYLNLKNSLGQPHLVNVRHDPEAFAALRARGFDIDKAMVVQVGAQYYAGARALHVLAGMSTRADWFNKINGVIFSIGWLATLFYPLMALGRNVTLAMLGRPRIAPRNPADQRTFDLYSIFAFGWACYTLFHFCYLTFYVGTITPPPNLLSWIMAALALGVVFRPWDTRIFTGMVIVALTEMWTQMPLTSNHAIIEFFMLIGIVLCGAQALISRMSWAEFFRLFAPAGRWLLIIMYFYGIFHKINTDFLNPEYSCAVALWAGYPFPSFLRDGLWAHYAAIYGTFIIEGTIIAALLIPRLRYYAIIAGCCFHMFLGISTYAFYGAFSMLSFALHLLFLPDTALGSLRQTRLWYAVTTRPALTRTVLALFFLCLYMAAATHILLLLIALFLIGSLPLLYFVCIARTAGTQSNLSVLRPALIPGLVALAFFLNNAAPYMGLKTHQSMNMFSNLHLDGERSNHLIMPHPPSLFPYLSDTVIAREVKTAEGKIITLPQQQRMVYHDFLALMNRNPTAKFTYEHEGVTYRDRTLADLKPDFDRIVQPAWLRKWMHFEKIDMRNPRPCEGFK